MATVSPILIAVALATASYGVTGKFSLTPTGNQNNNGYRRCITRNNETGVCVPPPQCDDDHGVLPYGRILEADLRLSLECTPNKEWCCSLALYNPSKRPTEAPTEMPTEAPTETPTVPPVVSTKKPKCGVSNGKNCPWCVYLYRDGEIYCMGTMIGSTVILTLATCIIQGEDRRITARIHEATDPGQDYVVKFKMSHPEYNSGTRFHDVGLMVIDEVQWGPNGIGACYSTDPPFNTLYLGAGVDGDDNLELRNLVVREGSCFGKSGAVNGTMCGTVLSGPCNVKPGAPIMKRDKPNSRYVLQGVAKLSCIKDKVIIENLNNSATWLFETLKGTMFLQDDEFLYNLNYL